MHAMPFALTLLIAFLAVPTSLSAQAQPISVGDVIRVTSSASPMPVEGTLTSMTATEWTLLLKGDELRRLDPSRIVGLELRTMRRDAQDALRGAWIGAGAGLVFGVAWAAEDECTVPSEFCQALGPSLEAFLLVGTSVIGAGVGAVFGALVKTAHWVPGFAPDTQRQGFAFSLTWALSAPW
jgi:hypothetical protein